CLKVSGITCIQGPPGTGKTTTIMGVISVILNAQSRGNTAMEKKMAELQVDLEDTPQNTGTSAPSSDSENEAVSPHKRLMKKLGARKAAIFKLTMPWLFEAGYKPWPDHEDVELEDVADPRPLPIAPEQREY